MKFFSAPVALLIAGAFQVANAHFPGWPPKPGPAKIITNCTTVGHAKLTFGSRIADEAYHFIAEYCEEPCIMDILDVAQLNVL